MSNFLESLMLSDKHLQYSYDCLDAIAAEELSFDESRERTRRVTAAEIDRQLENLTRLRIAEQISDSEFKKERKRLSLEKASLSRQDDRKRKLHESIELLRSAFSFATLAKINFDSGGRQEKREVLQKVGSNFSLKDKNLLIEAKKPFKMILERPKCLSLWTRGDSNS